MSIDDYDYDEFEVYVLGINYIEINLYSTVSLY